MDAKHTPGPWRIDEAKVLDNPDDYAIVSAGGKVVAEVPAVNRIADTTHKTNARLIAAAPELLEALKVVLGWPEPHKDGCYGGERCRCWVPTVRAAIAKAEGR